MLDRIHDFVKEILNPFKGMILFFSKKEKKNNDLIV